MIDVVRCAQKRHPEPEHDCGHHFVGSWRFRAPGGVTTGVQRLVCRLDSLARFFGDVCTSSVVEPSWAVLGGQCFVHVLAQNNLHDPEVGVDVGRQLRIEVVELEGWVLVSAVCPTERRQAGLSGRGGECDTLGRRQLGKHDKKRYTWGTFPAWFGFSKPPSPFWERRLLYFFGLPATVRPDVPRLADGHLLVHVS